MAGWPLTSRKAMIERINPKIAVPRKHVRQPMACPSNDNGYCDSKEPTPPTPIMQPEKNRNSREENQFAPILFVGTKIELHPKPTNNLPTQQTVRFGENEQIKVPIAEIRLAQPII